MFTLHFHTTFYLMKISFAIDWTGFSYNESGVTVAGVKDSCESKGEPEVDQTNGPPSALM